MKKIVRNLVILSVVMSFMVVFSNFKCAHSYELPGHADLIAPIGISHSLTMNFGTLMPGASAGTINPDHSVITGPIASQFVGNDPEITITGMPNFTVNLTIDPTFTISTVSSDTMVVTVSAPDSVELDGSGQGSLDMTGTLNVGANQPTGLYYGTCTITANY